MTTHEEQIYRRWAEENKPIVQLLQEFRTIVANTKTSLDHLDVARKLFSDQKCGRCNTCQYYQLKTGFNNMTCKHPKMVYGYGLETTDEPDQVLIEDDEGWGMIPGPEFGCIHHEEKQSDDNS